jgi:lipoprotein-anchoring transpeptidase ErfK/SrfK
MDGLIAFVRAHRWPVVAGTGAIVLAGALVGGAYAYDASQSGVIADGVRIGFVDVGGLTPAQARAKLRRAYDPLRRPLTARAGERRFSLPARRAGVELHATRAVDAAVDQSRDGWFLTRAVRELAGRTVDVTVRAPVTASRHAVGRFVHRVTRTIEQRPLDAKLVAGPTGIHVVKGRDGINVNSAALRRRVRDTLLAVGAPRVVPVPRHHVSPKTTVAKLAREYPSYITVDRSRFQLRVYQDLKLMRTYTIAVGQVGLETPAGLYHIQNMAVNPAWTVPNSAWAGSLAGTVVPPGPANPLQARWLGIFNGAGIHGTSDLGSLGSAASHGCIRMAIPDVIDLYDRVDVGTPIYIG